MTTAKVHPPRPDLPSFDDGVNVWFTLLKKQSAAINKKDNALIGMFTIAKNGRLGAISLADFVHYSKNIKNVKLKAAFQKFNKNIPIYKKNEFKNMYGNRSSLTKEYFSLFRQAFNY